MNHLKNPCTVYISIFPFTLSQFACCHFFQDMHWVVLSSKSSWHVLQKHQLHGTLSGPCPPFWCFHFKFPGWVWESPPPFNGILKCPLLRRVSYFSCLLGWFSHMFLLATEGDIAFGIGDIFPHGNWYGYVSIPCSLWRHWTCFCCNLWLSLNWMSARRLFTTEQKL